MINKQEIKYIITSGIFGIVWFVFLFPIVIKNFSDNSPITPFFIFNIGIYAFLFIFLKSMITNIGTNIKTSLGLIFLFMSLDVFLPEYHVALSGALIPGAALGVASTDYFLGYIATNSFHLGGIFVYLFTYILIPLVFLILSAKLLPNFVKHI